MAVLTHISTSIENNYQIHQTLSTSFQYNRSIIHRISFDSHIQSILSSIILSFNLSLITITGIELFSFHSIFISVISFVNILS